VVVAELILKYPFVPKTNAKLEAGQFWGVPLSDGRFACGRVLRVDQERSYGARTMFVAGLLDWVGNQPPTEETIAGSRLLEAANAHVRLIQHDGGLVLGHRPLYADEIIVPQDVSSTWGFAFLKARAEHLFVQGEAQREWEIREVGSPLTDGMLSPFAARTGTVQFKSMLTDDDFKRLADWLRGYPLLKLRAYGSYDGSITDLDFLKFFPFVRAFSADALYHSLQTLQGLSYLSDELEDLAIGWTKKKLDLGIISRFKALRTLYLEGQIKGIAVLSELATLEDLTLRSITLPDLSLLLPLKRLLALDLKLGGTKDLTLLPEIGKLQYLELWMVKGLSDISPIGRLPHLRYLFLEALRRVEKLPDLSTATELRRVHLQTMKGLRDLRPLATAPALEEILLVDMGHLQPDDLRCLVGLPSLKGVTAHLGSVRKTKAAEALIRLPEATQLKRGWREV
jgi:internalin A